MSKVELNRDYKIDILRFIAIICIILAHTNPPQIIFLLRNFDVTLMVIVMGVSFYLSNNKNINYKSYIKKRFKRLIVPTWQFLTIFFVFFYIMSLLTNTKYQFGIKNIILSYFLIGGIGYIWIMRVFFVVAILNPIVLKISNKIKNNRNFFILWVLIYISYFGLTNINLIGKSRFLFENILLYGIGWGLISSIGIRIKKITKQEMYIYTSIWLVIFMCLMFKYNFDSIQNYKYPPTMYYISYGMFISFILFIILDSRCIQSIFNNKFVEYISKNSLWIYLWHIIPTYILDIYGNLIPIINKNFIIKFIFIFTFSILTTRIQEIIKCRIQMYKLLKIKKYV